MYHSKKMADTNNKQESHTGDHNSEGQHIEKKYERFQSPFWQRWKGFAVACLYGVTSISITFFNKAVFVYGFDASNFLTLGQIVFSLVFLMVMKANKQLDYEDFSVATAQTLFPLAAAFVGMVVTGLAALIYVNVPIYSALRRLTTFIVIVWQYLLLNKSVPQNELLSVILMVFGAMVAGWGDLTFDLYGYFLTGINCIVTAWYLVLIAKKSQETGIKTFGLMFYNNVLSLPIMIVICYITEWDIIINFDKWWDIGFQICFIMSCLQAFLLNYFLFLCSTINSPLTTSITGQLKSILQTVFGLFAFNDVVITGTFSAGLGLSTLGGVWYGWEKYREQAERAQRERQERLANDLESGGKSNGQV